MLMASTSVADAIATMGPAAPGSPACSSRGYRAPADHVVKRYGQVLQPRDRAGQPTRSPDRSSRVGYRALRTCLNRERCMTGPVHCPVCHLSDLRPLSGICRRCLEGVLTRVTRICHADHRGHGKSARPPSGPVLTGQCGTCRDIARPGFRYCIGGDDGAAAGKRRARSRQRRSGGPASARRGAS